MSEKTAYPLCWPQGRPRTRAQDRKHARFRTSFAIARNKLIKEIRLLGGTDSIFSSNIPRRNDGLPYATAKPVDGDPGIACYFKRNGRQMCFACDCYLTVDDNLYAIAMTVGALRGIARWGTGDMMEAAFTGFLALPEPSSSWWDVLGVPVNSSAEQVGAAFRQLAKKHHPDVGGNVDEFRRVKEAYDQFLKCTPK